MNEKYILDAGGHVKQLAEFISISGQPKAEIRLRYPNRRSMSAAFDKMRNDFELYIVDAIRDNGETIETEVYGVKLILSYEVPKYAGSFLDNERPRLPGE
jgi:hypothetical protein